MKDLGDGPSWQRDVECDPKPIKKEPYHPGEMAYFEFTGPETKQTRKCYGYVIITPTHSDQHTTTTTTTTTTMQIGAVITKTGENSFTVVDQLPTAQHTRNISKKTHRQKFDKFLGDFKPIAQWSDTIKAWKEATGEQKQAMKAAGTEVRMSEWLLEHPEGPGSSKRPRPEDKDAAPAPDAKRLKPAPPLHPAHPPTARLLHPAIAPPYPPGAPPHSGPGSRQSLPPIRDMFHGPWSFDHQGAAGCSSGSNSCQPPRQQ
ncbi:hypothetical protein BDP27DRAFT_1360377 [Rhodocollybia butyracea]|uniref:Uncharacterized protein n=1 Tax=Rhodocollybia butyracea TaxID=206335 RepID=A0A9P5Q094_9AGAR|nr:hypothetical protein BDP27DRAFT_1360377 [Rhodocollybia butyracea]